jgi:hypothetical protein
VRPLRKNAALYEWVAYMEETSRWRCGDKGRFAEAFGVCPETVTNLISRYWKLRLG